MKVLLGDIAISVLQVLQSKKFVEKIRRKKSSKKFVEKIRRKNSSKKFVEKIRRKNSSKNFTSLQKEFCENPFSRAKD
jgi:hypothetical protein